MHGFHQKYQCSCYFTGLSNPCCYLVMWCPSFGQLSSCWCFFDAVGKLNGACFLLFECSSSKQRCWQNCKWRPISLRLIQLFYGIYDHSGFAQSFHCSLRECLSPGLDVSIPCRLQCQRSLDPLDTHEYSTKCNKAFLLGIYKRCLATNRDLLYQVYQD